MRYIATFDIGTTAIKGVLVTEDWQIAAAESREVETLLSDGFQEQDPVQWYEGFCSIAQSFAARVPVADICGIVMSGQMQDLIPLDAAGRPVRTAILYSDGRAAREAAVLAERIGPDELERVTGNHFDGSLPFPKLAWLKSHDGASFTAAHKVVFSSKDAVIARLCGRFVTDATTASTVGCMDIHAKTWQTDWVEAVGLDASMLPELLYADEEAGRVTGSAAAETGFAIGTPVYAGTGDAGATTLASGISAPGEYNINLGTSGWVATVSDGVLKGEGVFNLAAMPRGRYINVVPFLNAGNIHKWISQTLTPDDTQGDKYSYGDKLLAQSVPGSNGLLCLPYLSGERFPVMDSGIRGAYVGITPDTTKQDMMRAALEGVAFSIRQGLESLRTKPVNVSLIGGGAQTEAWCQILADVLNYPVRVYRDSEFAPALAISAAAWIAQGAVPGYRPFVDMLRRGEGSVVYTPGPAAAAVCDAAYQRYLTLYPAIRQIRCRL